MGLFSKKRTDGATYDGQGEERQGLVDVIKYNGEADEMVWKFPYENITSGAQLVVNQSQEAIFFKGGAVCDIFGPGTHTLNGGNLPILQKLINLPFGGKTPFTAEVWFVNKTVKRNLGFGTQVPIELLDPLYGMPIPVRSYGEYGIKIENSASFIEQMVGTLHLTLTDDIVDQFRALIVRKLTSFLGKFITAKHISVVQIGAHLDELSDMLRDAVAEEFAIYGLKITNFDVESVNYDKDDPNVAQVLQAQTAASSMDFESAAMARKRAREGYTYQQERQFDVMQGAAQNEGSAGQMMGAGMGLGMGFGVGGAMGDQMSRMAGVMGAGASATTPPPPPPQAVAAFHVLVGGAQQGPFDMAALGSMASAGQLTPQSYVWKQGMAAWAHAADVPELAALFAPAPPPPPVG